MLQPLAALSSDPMGFLLQSAFLGCGIALLPAYNCQAALATGALVHLMTGWTSVLHEMSMMCPSRENPSRAQLAFRDYVSAYDFSAFAQL